MDPFSTAMQAQSLWAVEAEFFMSDTLPVVNHTYIILHLKKRDFIET